MTNRPARRKRLTDAEIRRDIADRFAALSDRLEIKYKGHRIRYNVESVKKK